MSGSAAGEGRHPPLATRLPTLATALWRHAHTRGATRPEDPLLRSHRQRPISRSHYDALWKRIRTALPWAAKQQISTHWLRHTTLTWVERHYGYGVARDFAGHTDRQGASTTTYIRATIEETATALATMTGELHPLARSRPPTATRARSDRARGIPPARPPAPPDLPLAPMLGGAGLDHAAANAEEIATALADLTGEPHPLVKR